MFGSLHWVCFSWYVLLYHTLTQSPSNKCWEKKEIASNSPSKGTIFTKLLFIFSNVCMCKRDINKAQIKHKITKNAYKK